MLSLLRLGCQQKDFLKSILNSHIQIFLSDSFGIEVNNTFMHSHVPSKTIPKFRSQKAKSIRVFRPKRCKNHTLRSLKRKFFGPLGLIWFTNQRGRGEEGILPWRGSSGGDPPLDPPPEKKLLLVLKTEKANNTIQLLR